MPLTVLVGALAGIYTWGINIDLFWIGTLCVVLLLSERMVARVPSPYSYNTNQLQEDAFLIRLTNGRGSFLSDFLRLCGLCRAFVELQQMGINLSASMGTKTYSPLFIPSML